MAKIVHFTSSLKRGGAEAVLNSLVHGLQGSFDQTVLYIHDGLHRHTLEQQGIVCIQIYGIIGVYDPFFLMRLYKIMHALKPDLIHTLLWAAIVSGRVVGRMLNIPVVTVYHGNLDQEGIFRNTLDQLTMPLSTINCAVSSGVAQSIKVVSPSQSALIIHNGIESMYSESSRSRAGIGLTNDQFVIGAVGRLVKIKRFDLLIDAIALIHKKQSNVRLCLIGMGPEFDELHKQVQQQNLQHVVVFLLDVPAVEYYHLFDCFVLPSPREGVSIALLEAMRAHRSVIVVSESEHPVVHHEYNGLVVPYANAQLLAQCIKRIKGASDAACMLGLRARETVMRSFNRNAMVAQYTQMFRSVMYR